MDDHFHPIALQIELRDYFIAHAPTEPQPWFQPVMPTERPSFSVPYPTNLTEEEKHDKELFLNDMIGWEDMSDHRVKAYHAENARIKNERGAWDAEQSKQRYIQWPAAWADAMLAARNAADPKGQS